MPGKGKGAPEGNQYALKEGEGMTVSFYLSSRDVAFICRLLAEQGVDLSTIENRKIEVRKFARNEATKGVYRRIRSYMDAEIL